MFFRLLSDINLVITKYDTKDIFRVKYK